MRNKNSTSYRLSPEARVVIEELAKRLGVSKTDVVELAIRKFAKAEGVEIVEQK